MEVQPDPLLTLLKDDIHQSENQHCQAKRNTYKEAANKKRFFFSEDGPLRPLAPPPRLSEQKNGNKFKKKKKKNKEKMLFFLSEQPLLVDCPLKKEPLILRLPLLLKLRKKSIEEHNSWK